MNTILVRYGHSVRKKQYTKNPNAIYAVKAEISMKTISFSDSAIQPCQNKLFKLRVELPIS